MKLFLVLVFAALAYSKPHTKASKLTYYLKFLKTKYYALTDFYKVGHKLYRV